MELQIQNEKIDIKRSLGIKRKNINIEKDYILPDSKPDIIKVQTENAQIYMIKKEKMENKVKIDGGVTLRVTYLTGEGKNKVLKIEESFSEMVEIEGINESSFINENLQISNIKIDILNERKIHIRIDGLCEIKASKKENIEFIHKINPIHQLQTLNKKIKIKSYIGHGETKINLQEKLEVENLQENIEVIKLDYQINNIEKKMSYNKVLVKADCSLKCLYITEAGSIYITKKEVPIMGFLDIENVEDNNECSIEFSLKNLVIAESTVESNPAINIEMEFNVTGDIYQNKEIDILEDLYCLNSKTNFSKQKVMIEDNENNRIMSYKVQQKILIEDINQIYDTECKIVNYQIVGKYVEGDAKLTFLYSSFENNSINKKEETIKFQLTLEEEKQEILVKATNIKANILPDSNVETEVEFEIYDTKQNNQEIELINNIEIEDSNDDDGYSMIIYFVKKDDSLWKIAKRFNSTISQITNINEITNEDKIQVGDKLYIPRAM